ncbi:MAG: DUF512 domain-containing protein [Clostridia bacterium]|nr:DUF512 domain-containing protein [Clostridia bacterium]
MVRITEVEKNSLAAKNGICVDDTLISVNGHEIRDVLDYRFYLTEARVALEIEREGIRFEVVIKKDEYDDIGLDFETPLMDKKKTCKNKCIFCFIDQMPKGMRDTLYFKDDDERLSFLHGNYVTLTNLQDRDIDRIVEMHLSPVNISVHTTDPDLRVKMMKNKRAGEVLSYIPRLTAANIEVNAQIVLCKGYNDGEALKRTLSDLAAITPKLNSVSVVPAGLTDHREGLCPLTHFSDDDCAECIDIINSFGDKMREEHGERTFFASDEFYLRCGRELPEEAFYEGYPQLENGVGMCTLFVEDSLYALDSIDGDVTSRTVSIATGHAAYPILSQLAKRIEKKYDGMRCNVYAVDNLTFGKSITVSGLLTGKDILAALKDKELGEELFIPINCLRTGVGDFLDGMYPSELSEALGVKITACDGAEELVSHILGKDMR